MKGTFGTSGDDRGYMSAEAENTAMDVRTSTGREGRFRYSTSTKAASLVAAQAVPDRRLWLGIGAVAFGMVVLFWAEMRNLVNLWATDAGWSHGFVVPALAALFAYWKWDVLSQLTPRGTVVGLGLLVMGVIGHVLFRATGTIHMSYLSMLVVLYGVVLWSLGWQYLQVLWMPISYLVFAMVPPSTLYVKLTTPMQTLAAELGVRLMPLLGGEGFRQGTTIRVKHGTEWATLFVEDACSGMRMLVAFFALAVALAYTTSRPMWEKVVLAAAALPIAIFCNAMRVALTGVMGMSMGMEYTKGTPHAMLGLVMLVPAMGLQLGLAWVLDKIFIDDGQAARGAA
jgi:exosortase